MPVTPDEFRAALSRFTSGITVITSRSASGESFGITVSAFCSVSLTPPMVLACIENTTRSHSAISETGVFVVNILAAGHEHLSERFSIPMGNRFEGVATREGIDGLPVLEDALVTIECRLDRSHDGGDHTIFVGLVENVSIRDAQPLVYFHGNYHQLLDD